MSLDLLTSVIALLIPLWVVIACIHPATGGVAGWRKRFIVLTGFIAFIALAIVAPAPDTSSSAPETTSFWDALLIIVFMAALIGWPVVALTRRFGNPPAFFKNNNQPSKVQPDTKVGASTKSVTPKEDKPIAAFLSAIESKLEELSVKRRQISDELNSYKIGTGSKSKHSSEANKLNRGFFSGFESKPKSIQKAQKPSTSKATRAIARGWSIGEVSFTYEDANGDITYRTVTAHSVTSEYLKGECHDRQAERTFRLDRIIGDVVDRETGEILSPREWARSKR